MRIFRWERVAKELKGQCGAPQEKTKFPSAYFSVAGEILAD